MQRRDFLKNFGIAGAVLSLPNVAGAAIQQNISVKRDITNITIRGKVQSNNKGIANVAVTDGINVVLTDQKGNYELLSNRTTDYVYISIPAGYAIPNEKGIANFYQPVNSEKKKCFIQF